MQTTANTEAFRQKFRLDELTIMSNKAWTLSVRPHQVTLGSMVLSSTQGSESFAALSEGASLEMAALMAKAESISQHLGAARVNFLALMMQDPIVHFHAFPRYAAPVEFDGEMWVDSDWPRPPNLLSSSGRTCDAVKLRELLLEFL